MQKSLLKAAGGLAAIAAAVIMASSGVVTVSAYAKDAPIGGGCQKAACIDNMCQSSNTTTNCEYQIGLDGVMTCSTSSCQ